MQKQIETEQRSIKRQKFRCVRSTQKVFFSEFDRKSLSCSYTQQHFNFFPPLSAFFLLSYSFSLSLYPCLAIGAEVSDLMILILILMVGKGGKRYFLNFKIIGYSKFFYKVLFFCQLTFVKFMCSRLFLQVTSTVFHNMPVFTENKRMMSVRNDF